MPRIRAKLPDFERSASGAHALLERRHATARFIRSIWMAAERKRHLDKELVLLLVQLGWNNEDDAGRGNRSTWDWRNEKLALYMNLDAAVKTDVIRARFTDCFSFQRHIAKRLFDLRTGIAHYYTALRPRTLDFIEKKWDEVLAAFCEVSNLNASPRKIERVAEGICGFGSIETPNDGEISLFNGLTPTLAALDPNGRFPIMNKKTEPLLRKLEAHKDVEGAMKLSDLIGTHKLRDAFDLDVYSVQQFHATRKKRL